jgi:RNA polymerase sigma factor (sigma-70 family)
MAWRSADDPGRSYGYETIKRKESETTRDRLDVLDNTILPVTDSSTYSSAPALGDGQCAPATAESRALALARAASGGDALATRQLLTLIGPRLSAVVRVVLGPHHPDLDDALQQSLIAFVQALPSFRGECPPTYFAARIAVRIAVAVRRQARAQHVRHDDLADPDAIPTRSEASATTAMGQSTAVIVRELLESLPEAQAESLALRVVLGWTVQEVAVAMGVPLNTVRSRVRLAKEALRRRIDADPALREILRGDR